MGRKIIRKKVYVSVSYDSDLYFAGTVVHDDDIERLAMKHGGISTGSGMGFGERDIGFEFPSREFARTFLTALRKAYKSKKVKFTTTIDVAE